MATGQLTLIFIGGLATLASMAIFLNGFGYAMKMVFGMLGAVMWGVFALASMNVITASNYAAVRTDANVPLMIVGAGLAMILFLYVLYLPLKGMETEAPSQSDLLQ